MRTWLGTRAQLQLEILALRHQVTVLRRQTKVRTPLTSFDRAFWGRCHVVELQARQLGDAFDSRGCCHSLPCHHRLAAKLAKRVAAHQMALDVEGVVDGGVGGEKSLR